jgi:hypothetical protein
VTFPLSEKGSSKQSAFTSVLDVLSRRHRHRHHHHHQCPTTFEPSSPFGGILHSNCALNIHLYELRMCGKHVPAIKSEPPYELLRRTKLPTYLTLHMKLCPNWQPIDSCATRLHVTRTKGTKKCFSTTKGRG